MKRSAALLSILGVLGAACSQDSTGNNTVASRLILQVAPAPSALNGVVLDPAPVVQLADNSGASVAQHGVLVTASVSEGPGTVGGTTEVRTDSDGQAVFAALTLSGTIGVKTIRFSAAGLGSVKSGSIALQAGPPASAIPIEGNNQSATAGTSLQVAPAVKVLDSGGNPVPGITVTFEILTGSGAVTGAVVVTGADGIARVGGWTLGPPGVNSLRAVVAGLESQPVSFTATAVMPVPVAFTTGNNQTGFAGDQLTKDIVFRLVDVSGVPRVGVPVTFTVTAGGGSFSQTTIVTDANGSGTTRWTLGPAVGTQRAVATAPNQGDGLLTATAVRFVTITGAGESSCGLTSEGAAYCWGGNFLTQLGDGTTVAFRPRAGRVVGGHVFEKLASATDGNFSCGIKAGGEAWCWGSARHGQLGDGTLPLGGGSSSSSPIAVAGGIAFGSIEPGGDHNCGLDLAGLAYCWGANNSGQLGDGTLVEHPTPARAAIGFTFIQLATGFEHSCGLTFGGDVYCWGNRSGYLVGNIADRTTPIQVPSSTKFSSIVAGRFHTCGLNATGNAYCWGSNGSGQIGDGTTTSRGTATPVTGGRLFVSISAGGSNTCGVQQDGTAFCWGKNDLGEAGVGHTNPVRAPTPVDGGLLFSSLGVGFAGTCGLVDPGIAWCWGPNADGQVGDGTQIPRLSPTRVGF